MHHVFDTRHPDTWNWTVSLSFLVAGRNLTFTATDAASDSLTCTCDWGDGTPAAVTYYNDRTAPDLYPSPGNTFLFTTTNSQVYRYFSAGRFDLKLTVRDDDGGMIKSLVVIVIDG